MNRTSIISGLLIACFLASGCSGPGGNRPINSDRNRENLEMGEGGIPTWRKDGQLKVTPGKGWGDDYHSKDLPAVYVKPVR